MIHCISAAAWVTAATAFCFTPPPFIHEGPAAIDEQTTIMASPPRPFCLAILPDRTTGRDWGLPYLRMAVADLNRIQPDAVFTIGDMVQGYTRNEQEWERQATQWKDITNHLTVPLFPVAGNHDVISGSRVPGDNTFGNKYLRTFGPLRYMAELDGATVISLFSDESYGDGGVKLGDGQIGWLKTCLDRAKLRDKPIVVIMHRPLWRTASVKWFERVHPSLVEAGVDLVIAGHFHSMQDEGERDGIHYNIVGTCGGSIDQHPLAGQMQHLSFLQMQPDGRLAMFHQPVGVTLPADFVTRADQDRVFALRDKPGSLSQKGSLADPMATDQPLTGSTTLVVTNPLDRAIEVSAHLYTTPEPWMVDGEMFLSRTAVDAFNPFTVHAETAYTLGDIAPISIAAGASAQLTLNFAWPRATKPVAPPTVIVREVFSDSKGRSVPVFLYVKPAIERTIPLSTIAAITAPIQTTAWPIHVWAPSPYDTLEPDPTMQVWMKPDGRTMCIRVQATDANATVATSASVAMDHRIRDPSGDAIVITWNDSAGAGTLLVEPFTPLVHCNRDGVKPVVTKGQENAGSWWAQMEWTLDAGLPTTLNVGVADNDQTYHTQWRWLAPDEFPARVVAAERSSK